MSGKLKETSTTKLVEDALRKATADGEFLNYHMLRRITGRGKSPVTGALHSLRRFHVADVVIQDGIGWWFALPPEMDARLRTCDEHVPHPTGIKRNRAKLVKVRMG